MRRTLAGLLFGLAYACATLAISGFLLQRTAFNPDNSSAAAGVILGDNAIRAQLVSAIIDNSSTPVIPDDVANRPLEIERLRRLIAKVAQHPDGQPYFAQIVHDAHARLIGDHPGPVEITGEELVSITRTQRAATTTTFVLSVPEVTALAITNHVTDWLVPILAIAAVVLLLAGLSTHPEKESMLKTLAVGMVVLALTSLIMGYLVPKFAIPALSKSVWAHIPARLADEQLPLVIGMMVVLILGAFLAVAGSGMMRRQRRWSQPISTYRYSEERRWS